MVDTPQQSTFGTKVRDFLLGLSLPVPLPDGFEVIDPYRHGEVRRVVTEFTTQYYHGDHQRLSVWGINPGRFGAGLTGLAFTDPEAVRTAAGIATSITGRRELSAEYVWQVVQAYGGPSAFFSDVYLSALCPLGFLRNGTNINFYDDRPFTEALVPTLVEWISTQISAGLRTDVCIVLGTGRLKQVMERYLQPQLPFRTVIFLEHPRYIMQYRRAHVGDYVQRYVDTLLRYTR